MISGKALIFAVALLVSFSLAFVVYAIWLQNSGMGTVSFEKVEELNVAYNTPTREASFTGRTTAEASPKLAEPAEPAQVLEKKAAAPEPAPQQDISQQDISASEEAPMAEPATANPEREQVQDSTVVLTQAAGIFDLAISSVDVKPSEGAPLNVSFSVTIKNVGPEAYNGYPPLGFIFSFGDTVITPNIGLNLLPGKSKVIYLTHSYALPDDYLATFEFYYISATGFSDSDSTNNKLSVPVHLGGGTTDIDASVISVDSVMVPEGEKVAFKLLRMNTGTATGRIEAYNFDFGDGQPTGAIIDSLFNNIESFFDYSDLPFAHDGGLVKTPFYNPVRIAAGNESDVTFWHIYRKPGKYAATFDFVSSNDINAENNKVAVDVTTTGQGPGLFPLDKNIYTIGEKVHLKGKDVIYEGEVYTYIGPRYTLTMINPGGAIFNVPLVYDTPVPCTLGSDSQMTCEHTYVATFDNTLKEGEYTVTLTTPYPWLKAYEDKASFTVVLPAECQQLSDIFKASYESSCGDVRYNPVADLDKDTHVTIKDSTILFSRSSDAEWCSNALNNVTDPCMPTECQALLGRIKTSYGGTCLLGATANYDPAADLDGSKTIDISDFTIFAINSYNAAWCDEKVNNANDTCVHEVPAECQQLKSLIIASYTISECDIKYNATADLNKDKSVAPSDMLLLAANLGDAAWCAEKLNNIENPCLAS